jgi:hypothetical protein
MPRPQPFAAPSGSPVRPDVIDRAVYGTIVVASVLVVYDGWSNLKLADAIAVILGPVLAMVIGHVFAASMAAYPELGQWRGRDPILRVDTDAVLMPSLGGLSEAPHVCGGLGLERFPWPGGRPADVTRTS